ncbi:hypothetical protein PNOK_0712800 [Pyrrhoderma noxium]|uniref:Uncharacterized protein n=1 Tax=Pyrrhoderma noxium TaxID=2282107 RepID=A0A286UBZ8_9AGAM|nr:hypothetical protein PNOK_0712800 [Pyrrhoderma noxium]
MSRWITKQLSPVTLSLFGPFPRSILQQSPIRRISRQIRFSFSPSLSPRRQGNAGILPKSKAFLFRFFLPSPSRLGLTHPTPAQLLFGLLIRSLIPFHHHHHPPPSLPLSFVSSSNSPFKEPRRPELINRYLSPLHQQVPPM